MLHYATSAKESGVPATVVLQQICEHCWYREISRSCSAQVRHSKQACFECLC
jgi:hypothetical protein